MMHSWIICTIFFFLLFTENVVSQASRTLEIVGSNLNRTVPVWIGDNVTIKATDRVVTTWSFNNTIIAFLPENQAHYNYTHASLLNNIDANVSVADSFLTLNNVNHNYTGSYKAEGFNPSTDTHLLQMTVHDVYVSPIEFNLVDWPPCRAYILLNNTFDPVNSEIARMPISSELTFSFTDLSSANRFEITSSTLNTTNSSMNITINIQYTFTTNNFSIIRPENVLLDASFVSKPNAVIRGIPGNRTVLIQHRISARCVRNINYCLRSSATDFRCNSSNTLNDLIVDYPWNSNVTNLSIVYDIIFAKYYVDIIVTNDPDQTTTTTNPSEPGGTTSQPDSTNGPTPANDSGGLAGWEIALIIIGAAVGVLLLIAIVGFCLWRNHRKGDRDKSSGYRPASHEQNARKTIPLSQSTVNSQPITTIGTVSTTSGVTTQRPYAQVSRKDSNTRPTIPQPRYRLSEPSNSPDLQSQALPSNYPSFTQSSISPPFNQTYQSQDLYNRREIISPNKEIML